MTSIAGILRLRRMKSEISVRVAAGLTAFQSMKKERRYKYGRWNRGRLAGMGGSLPPFWPRWRPLLRSATAAYDIFTVTNKQKVFCEYFTDYSV
jgi:hypothetical protein